MDLDVEFDGKILHTPIYVKMDAHDQLLLSEGVCRQLGILHYHEKVEQWRGRKKQVAQPATTEAKVPAVRVHLIRSLQLLPHQTKMVDVLLTPNLSGPFLLEPRELANGMEVDTALMETSEPGCGYQTPQGCRASWNLAVSWESRVSHHRSATQP